MTVAELIEKLSKFDPDMPVWVSSDPEGNDFDTLSYAGLFDTTETEVIDDNYSETYSVLEKMSEEDAEKYPQVVMLWP